ncbi:hypothetical protein [Maribellus maritimus]|uniref:hypothetical protein n=1 Tax=Maribellus maritimus TaxID=2870838 RepID=UPI001EEAEFFA|nr:hypothetical protein [Maribellus maritimus]MCG6186524.1 hypothetical protein [Maribellus maritimus]
MKFYNLFFIGIILSVFILSCDKEEDPSFQTKDMSIYDIKSETLWDYWIIGEKGDYLFVNESNGIPNKLFLSLGNASDGYSIFMDDSGRPQKTIIGDYIFLFDNFNGNNLDMAVIFPSGELKIERAINTGENWDLYSEDTSDNRESMIKWTGNIASGVASGIKAFEAKQPNVEFLFPLIDSEETILHTINGFTVDDYEILNLNTKTFQPISKIIGCSNKDTECALNIATTASLISNSSLEKFTNNEQKALAMQILSLTITTNKASEVTNNSALCNVITEFEEYTNTTSTYEFNVGIRYCPENDEPTVSGTVLSQKITYGPNSDYSFDVSFKLNELDSNKKYKYCAFIQHDDFIEFGHTNTFATVYVNIESLAQTGSAKGSFTYNNKSYEYEYYIAETCFLSGDTSFIGEWGIYTDLNSKHHPASDIGLGEINWTWTYWSNNSSVSDTHTPYIKFKNGEYYLGNPVYLSATHVGDKSTTINENNLNVTNEINCCNREQL